jgi:pimeloyl-ACP methyl ester carboxylesterase
LIISRDAHPPRPNHLPLPVSPSDWQRGNAIHDAAQRALTKLSTRSRRVIAKGSGHSIHFDRPQLLLRDVSAFVQRIRSGNAEPRNKTTVTE